MKRITVCRVSGEGADSADTCSSDRNALSGFFFLFFFLAFKDAASQQVLQAHAP